MTLMLVGAVPGRAEFLQIYNRLCVALREPADDTGVTQGIYFDALKDIPTPALDAGATALMRETGRRFFPTTAEWRTAAERAHNQQLRDAVKPAREEPWHFECGSCQDTGWIQHLECDGGADAWPEDRPKQKAGSEKFVGNRREVGFNAEARETTKPRQATCGRTKPHLPHTYTRACECRPTNRTYIRNQKFGKNG